MTLPAGIRSIRVRSPGQGISHHLDWPSVYGEVHGVWAVWDRHTGLVSHWFGHISRNVHGWTPARDMAHRASAPPADFAGGHNPFEYDTVA